MEKGMSWRDLIRYYKHMDKMIKEQIVASTPGVLHYKARIPQLCSFEDCKSVRN